MVLRVQQELQGVQPDLRRDLDAAAHRRLEPEERVLPGVLLHALFLVQGVDVEPDAVARRHVLRQSINQQ